MGGKPKKCLEDYRTLAIKMGFLYILEIVPKNVSTMVKGWKCKINHDPWSTTYSNIKRGTGCPHCANQIPKTIEDYKNMAKENGFKYLFDTIPKTTSISVLQGWRCSNNHVWDSCYKNIKRGSGCPQCAGNIKKVLNDYKKIAIDRGFKYTISDIPPNTRTTIRGWKCNKNHIFCSSYGNIKSGKGCVVCKHKTETLLYEYIVSIYNNVDVTPQFSNDWCTNIGSGKKIKTLPFDICINSLKIILEIDGDQHFPTNKCPRYWKKNYEEQYSRDIYKMLCANVHGYSIIRISQDDVWKNKFDWKEQIQSGINYLKQCQTAENIYLCYDDNKYNIYLFI